MSGERTRFPAGGCRPASPCEPASRRPLAGPPVHPHPRAASSTEPIIFPKLLIRFADFPSPHNCMKPSHSQGGDLLRFGVQRACAFSKKKRERNFKGQLGRRKGRSKTTPLCRAGGVPLGLTPSAATETRQSEKKTLIASRDGKSPLFVRCRSTTTSAGGNVDPLPFRVAGVSLRRKKHQLFTLRGLRSGLPHSWRITLPMKPFPSSAVRTLTALIATSTKICTKGGSTGAHAPASAPAPSRLPTCPSASEEQFGLGRRFHRHPFSPSEP